MRILGARRAIRNEPYDLWLATDMRMPSDVLNRLWLLLLMSLPVLLAPCALVAYWISGRALRPIQEIIAAARSIDSRRLSQRVAAPPTGDEVQQLAETLNGMLDRIEQGFQRMRQFTADASHELRTPVAVIRAAAEVGLLRRNATAEFYRETLERILRESQRNTALLGSMVELSRMDSGADASERAPIDLHCSLAEACERIAPLAASRGVELRCSPASPAVETLADRDQVRRLWLLLLDNAIKFTPRGDRSRLARVARRWKLPIRASASRQNTRSEYSSASFAPTKHAAEAGGIRTSLAIAGEIVRAQGATIRVQSRLGRGSVFTVTFPAGAMIGEEVSEDSQVSAISL